MTANGTRMMGCHGDSGPAVEGTGCYPQEEKPRNRNLKSFSYKTEYEANVDGIYLSSKPRQCLKSVCYLPLHESLLYKCGQPLMYILPTCWHIISGLIPIPNPFCFPLVQRPVLKRHTIPAFLTAKDTESRQGGEGHPLPE